MTTKEYLKSARNLQVIIDGKTERVQQLRALAQSTSATLDGMPRGNGDKDRLGNVVAAIVDFSREIARDTALLIERQRDIQALIARVQDTDYRTVLELYYLNGWRWHEVALRMNYSSRHIFRLHEEALRAVESVALNGSSKT